MSGLLLIGAAALWVAMLSWLVRKFGTLFPAPWRKLGQFALFALVLPLPLIDEIVGRWQFHQLCAQHNKILLNPETARGKTVYLAPDASTPVRNTWTPVYEQPWRFLDSSTNELVLSFSKFTAEGGVLIRSLRISEGNAPLLFSNHCEPESGLKYRDIFRDLDIKRISKNK